jgi:hypothetical protein
VEKTIEYDVSWHLVTRGDTSKLHQIFSHLAVLVTAECATAWFKTLFFVEIPG